MSVSLAKRPVICDDYRKLNSAVEFDSPFEVLPHGLVIAAHDVWAPVVEGETTPDGWAFVDGYSGQYGYRGPIMHVSEYLGGRMAADVMAEPGVYVVVEPNDDDPRCTVCDDPIEWSQEAFDRDGTEHVHSDGEHDHPADMSQESIGWALLRQLRAGVDY